MSTNLTVNDVVPPMCCTCDKPLTNPRELNRLIDLALPICDPCCEYEERDGCWCVYGWYLGGDPRQFEPDEENRPDEIAAWRSACEAWERGESVEPAAEEHGPWKDPATGKVTLGARPSETAVGVCSAPRAYGMGAIYCDQHKQPLDAWKSWPRKHGEPATAPAEGGAP